MTEKINSEQMKEMLKKEKENLLNEINSKIKKKKSFTELETGNEFLK